MNAIGTIAPLNLGGIARPGADLPLPKIGLPQAAPGAVPSQGFGQMLEGLVGTVEAKSANAQQLTRKVLLGDSDQLHQSVIAMQEASVAFTMMVEVRNKLVESYQELMRMQV
ncbi:MAG: flagellar hook-basal body complex protein FliE [Opitutaceae bacterium]|nr:flagellar hook-basal body complex protein FliE [Opitutaceae bacterium]